MNDLESDDESVDTPLVYPFPHSDNDSNDGEVLNELIEYENVGMLRREKAINSFDGDDLEFQCMIGFRKVVAYFDPFLPMNIITRKAYKTIMVEGLESTESKNLVDVVRNVYVFLGSFTYITDFVVLEDIGEFIQINKAEIVIGNFSLKNEEEIFTDVGDGVRIYPDGVASPAMLYLTKEVWKILGSFIGQFLEEDLTSSPHFFSILANQ
ncbi:hypothetical protein Tco_0585408 [Tanacetum coccineum]